MANLTNFAKLKSCIWTAITTIKGNEQSKIKENSKSESSIRVKKVFSTSVLDFNEQHLILTEKKDIHCLQRHRKYFYIPSIE